MKEATAILAECSHVEDLISQPVPDDSNLLRAYGDELSAWLATMARNVADARFIHRQGIEAMTKSVVRDEELKRLTPMVMNKYIGAAVKDYAYVEDMSDRMYSALAKRLAWVVSQLSYNKVEMQQLNK